MAVSPPLFGAAAALLIAKRFRVPFGVVVQDIYSCGIRELALDHGFAHLAGLLVSAVERHVVANAARVATIHQRFADRLVGLGRSPTSSTITVIANWTHVPDPGTPRTQHRQLLGWSDSHIVLHAGNMGEKQGLENVVDAARDADRRQLPVRYVLMGDGNQRRMLERRATGISRLQFLPSADAVQYASTLRAADVLLVNEKVGVEEMSLPSKLTSYCAAGRPIVAAVSSGGAASQVLLDSNAGIITAPGNPVTLNDTVLELQSDRSRADALGENGRAYARTWFSEETADTSYRRWIAVLAQGPAARFWRRKDALKDVTDR